MKLLLLILINLNCFAQEKLNSLPLEFQLQGKISQSELSQSELALIQQRNYYETIEREGYGSPYWQQFENTNCLMCAANGGTDPLTILIEVTNQLSLQQENQTYLGNSRYISSYGEGLRLTEDNAYPTFYQCPEDLKYEEIKIKLGEMLSDPPTGEVLIANSDEGAKRVIMRNINLACLDGANPNSSYLSFVGVNREGTKEALPKGCSFSFHTGLISASLDEVVHGYCKCSPLEGQIGTLACKQTATSSLPDCKTYPDMKGCQDGINPEGFPSESDSTSHEK